MNERPAAGAAAGAPEGMQGQRERLEVIGSETFGLQGDVHRLVTFLNQCLKDRELVFGLTRVDDGRYRLTVYRG